jgi:hypothetical protein
MLGNLDLVEAEIKMLWFKVEIWKMGQSSL